MADRETASPAGGMVAGLAIDDLVLRLVVLDRREGPRVVDVAEADLPAGLVRDGRVLDSAGLGGRIGELWRVMELVGVPTYLGFQPADAVVRCVRVGDAGAGPALVPVEGGWPAEVTDLVAAVRARDGVEPVWAASPVTLGGEAFLQVAACRREDMTNAVWAARRSGVWVAGVELSALALARALDPAAGATGVLVDRSASASATYVGLVDGVAVIAGRDSAPAGEGSRAVGEGGAGGLDVAMVATEAAAVRTAATVRTAAASGGVGPALRDLAATGTAGGPRLRRAGSGLAADSPVPAPVGATALGLALAAIEEGNPGDLQASLLDSSATLLGARRATIAGAARGEAPPAAPGTAPGPDDAPRAAVAGPAAPAAPAAALAAAGLADANADADDVSPAAEADSPDPAGPASSQPLDDAQGAGPGGSSRRLRWGAAVAAVAGATAVGAVWATRSDGSNGAQVGSAPTSSEAVAPPDAPAARVAPSTASTATAPAASAQSTATTSPATTASLATTTSLATITTTAVTETVRAPIVALPAHGGVYAGGKLYLEGAVPDQAMADRLRSIAAAVVGPENVIGEYLVDPAAPRDSEGRVRIEDTILFAVGSTQVAAGYAPALQLLVKAMELNPDAKLVVEGHTDIQGPLQLNLELSKARADAMVATLVQHGIVPARLVAVGKGPFLPRADNATEAGRAQNRRIELTFVGLLS